MQLTNENFRGSWAGLPVAWTRKNKFDEQTYRGDVARCCRLGMPGIYSGGTTGEFYAMEFDEFKEVARATVEEAHSAGVPAMIGVTSTYTLGAARRAAYAAEIGADAIQVALPYWMEVPDDSVPEFFREVSDAAGHMPLSVYETLRTKRALSLDQHNRVKSVLPNYIMVKSNAGTIGTTVEGCAALTNHGINVFGEEGLLWPDLSPHGMAGCCSSRVYFVPDIVLNLNRSLVTGDRQELEEGAVKLRLISEYVKRNFRSRGFLDSAIDRIGGIAGGVLRTSIHCRGPYTHGNDADVRNLQEWYRKNMPDVYARIEAYSALT